MTERVSESLTDSLREAFGQLPTVWLAFDAAEPHRVPIHDYARGERPQGQNAPPAAGTSSQLRQTAQRLLAGPPNLRNGVIPEIIEITDRNGEEGTSVPADTNSATAQADSYGIGLPPDWMQQPVDPAAFERSLADRLAQLRAQKISRADIRRFELLQQQIHDQLVAENVQYVATLAGRGPSEAETSDAEADGATLLLAGLVITTRTRSELGAPGPITTSLLLRSFGGSNNVEEGINVQEPSEVDLPAGKAFRLVRFHSQPLGTAERIEYYEHTFLLPHDGGERVAFLQFVTPTLGLSEPLGELFDAMATTLRIFYPDDPTTFETSPAESGA